MAGQSTADLLMAAWSSGCSTYRNIMITTSNFLGGQESPSLLVFYFLYWIITQQILSPSWPIVVISLELPPLLRFEPTI